MTKLSWLLVLLPFMGVSLAQRPATQNVAFTLIMDNAETQTQYRVPPLMRSELYTLSVRTVTSSFAAATPRAYLLQITCSSPNFASQQISPLAHMIPVLRNQTGLAVDKDMFSVSFGGWIPCLASRPIIFGLTRNVGGDKVSAPFTVSMLIEQIPLLRIQ